MKQGQENLRYENQGSVSGWLAEAHPYSPPRRPSLCPHWTVEPDLHNCHVQLEDDEDCDQDKYYDVDIQSREFGPFQYVITALKLMPWIWSLLKWRNYLGCGEYHHQNHKHWTTPPSSLTTPSLSLWSTVDPLTFKTILNDDGTQATCWALPLLREMICGTFPPWADTRALNMAFTALPGCPGSLHADCDHHILSFLPQDQCEYCFYGTSLIGTLGYFGWWGRFRCCSFLEF